MLKLLAGAAMAALVGVSTATAAPLEAYGRLPAMNSVKISNDGQKIAYINTEGPRTTVVVQSLDGTVLQTLEMGDRKVRSVRWTDVDHVVVMITETTTVANVFYAGEFAMGISLNVKTGGVVVLPKRSDLPVLNTLFGVQGGTYNGKPVIYAGLYSSDGPNMQAKDGHLDLYRIDPDSGIATQHQQGDFDTNDYLYTRNGTVLARTKYNRKDRLWALELRQGEWKNAHSVTAPIDTPDLVGLTLDEKSIVLNLWDDKEQTWNLRPLSIADKTLGAPIGDGGEYGVVQDDDARILGYLHDEIYREYDFQEPRLAAGWGLVQQAFPGRQLFLASFTPDLGKLVVFVEGMGEPGGYYLVDLTTKKVKRIGAAYPGLTAADLAPTSAIKYRAADGLEISGYLTLPNGRTAKGLPLIVLPHGGPQARDIAGFDWWAQALASRGYAVLQPNFRGSSGYGQKFLEAAYGEWGGKMQTDLSDGVRALAKSGTIDPKRVCIVGGSYGGYAALAGITLDKGVYRCAVAVAGVSDMAKMLNKEISQGGVNTPTVRYWKRYMGVDSPNDDKLQKRSPVNFAAQADGPVLLIHGKDDTIVYYDQSTSMRDALKRADKPVEFVSLKAEDHYLSREPTRQQAMAAMVTFLEKNNPPN